MVSLEERMGAAIAAVQAMLDSLKDVPASDPRQVAITRTQFETAFLLAANAAHGESILDG